MSEEKPIKLYECVHYWITKRIGHNVIVDRKEVLALLGELFHVPKEKRFDVIRELVEFGFLKFVDRDRLLVLQY